MQAYLLFFYHKNVIKEANSIIYDFLRKCNDKVQLSSILRDIEHVGLEAPQLESTIKTQRSCAVKKIANDHLLKNGFYRITLSRSEVPYCID